MKDSHPVTPGAKLTAKSAREVRACKAKAVVIAVFVAIPLLWLTSALVLTKVFPSPTDRGLFGDSFGAINALFSGLAFAGVIYAIILQRRELQYQREELELTRVELTRTAAAAEASASEATKARSSTAFFEVMALLDELRPLRHELYTFPNDSSAWDPRKKTLADKVATGLQRAAYISLSGLLEPEYIMEANAKVFVDCWAKLQGFVYEYRRQSGEPQELEAGGYQRKHFEIFSRQCHEYLRRQGTVPANTPLQPTGFAGG